MVTKAKSQRNIITLGILAAIGIVAYIMYQLIGSYGLGNLFTMPKLEFSFTFLAASVVSFMVWVYSNKQMVRGEISGKERLIGGAIISALTFFVVYQFLIQGLVIAAIFVAIFLLLWKVGGLKLIIEGIYKIL